MELHETIKEVLRAADGNRLPKEDSLAKEFDVSKATISNWINGNEPCSERFLAQLVERSIDGTREKRVQFVRLFLELGIHRAKKEKKKGWSPSGRKLARLALEEAHARIAQDGQSVSKRRASKGGRTLRDFPEAFRPLAVVCGDRRENGEHLINIADFGVVSAAPAEFRWLLKLNLSSDTEIYGDKVFVLEGTDELKARFGKRNLLVIGSPASNHLTRRLHLATPKEGWRRSVPIFRFNMMQKSFEQIEQFLEGLHGKNGRELLETRESPENNRKLAYWQRQLYKDGILDPTYRELWVRGTFMPQTRDFGLVSIARNPFSDPKEPYVCIMAAGFHMFGTAHALGFLAKPERFSSHPFGGVIRVDMDIASPFARRFDESTADWDGNSAYAIADVVDGLKKLRQEIGPEIRITQDEIDECLKFIETL